MFEIAAIVPLALVSAPHCAVMCGPLAACAAGDSRRRHAGYQLGRIGSYTVVGAIAGGAGRGLGELVPAMWVSAVATWLVALALVAAALSMIARPRRVDPRAPIPLRRRRRLPLRLPTPLFGLLTVFLPCGALWAAVAMAMSTGSVAGGAAAMAVFSLISGAAVAGATAICNWLRRRRYLLAAALITSAVMLALAPAARLAGGGDAAAPSCPLHEAP